MMKAEKGRSANFSPLEIQFLVELVSKKIDVLENKQNDTASVVKKNSCWDDVHAEFSSNSECQNRTGEQLKGLWRRLVKVMFVIYR